MGLERIPAAYCVCGLGLSDTGTVTELTERARQLCALEGLWGGPRPWQGAVHSVKSEHVSRLETEDTIVYGA